MPAPGPTHSLGSLRRRLGQRAGPSCHGHGSPYPRRHCKPLHHAPLALPAGKPSGSGPPSVGVLDRSAVASPPAASTEPASPSSAAAPAPDPPDMTTGYLSLSLVPILWGTYNPCIRYLYAEADPLDPASLTAVRTLLSAGALLLPALVGYLYKEFREAWSRRQQQQQQQQRQQHQQQRTSSGDSASGPHSNLDALGRPPPTVMLPTGHPHAQQTPPHPGGGPAHLSAAALAMTADGAADGVALAAVAPEAEEGLAAGGGVPEPSGRNSLFSGPVNAARLGPVLTRTFNSVVLGGLELGLLNFLGTALQVEGLHSTSATRAGFLAEVTAVLTPLVSYMAGYDIPRQLWLAVAVGLVGSTMVAYDTSQSRDTQPTAVVPAPAVASTTATAFVPKEAVAVVATGSDAAVSASQEVAAAAVPAPSDALSRGVSELAATATSSAAVTSAGAWDVGVADLQAGPMQDAVAATLSLGPAAVGDGGVEVAGALAGAVGFRGIADKTTAADAVASAVDAASAAVSTAAESVAEAAGAAIAASAGAALEATGAAASSTMDAAVAAAASAAAAGGATPLEITGGEAYLLLACFFFSLCTVRMGIYAPRMDTVGLAAMKKVGLSSMSVLWMASTNLQNGAALGSVFSFPDLSSRTPVSIAVLLYSGLGPGALATFLQVSGLSTVPATTAQVIYSMTPLSTAFFAYLILGGEATGPVAWAGGSLIIIAALMAANAQHRQHQQLQEEQQKRADCEAIEL